MNNITNDLDNYILLYDNINKSIIDIKNYETIKNAYNYKNKKLIKVIDEFLSENIKNKYKKLIDIIYDTKNEMSLIYKNDENIKLFGDLFIKNNKSNCFLLINDNQINELCRELSFNKKEKNIKIKLIEENDIENMSYMFCDCLSLLSAEMSKWNTQKIKYLDYIFLGCSSLD